MKCPNCNADMVPHTNLEEDTVWICALDNTSFYSPSEYDVVDEEELREYWLCHSGLMAS